MGFSAEGDFQVQESLTLPQNRRLVRISNGTRSERVRAWVRLGRPKFLLYSALLYGVGAMLALLRGTKLSLGTYLYGQLFVSCVHLMTHYCNEFFDFEADRANPAPTA